MTVTEIGHWSPESAGFLPDLPPLPQTLMPGLVLRGISASEVNLGPATMTGCSWGRGEKQDSSQLPKGSLLLTGGDLEVLLSKSRTGEAGRGQQPKREVRFAPVGRVTTSTG